jgi:hypothetical protein
MAKYVRYSHAETYRDDGQRQNETQIGQTPLVHHEDLTTNTAEKRYSHQDIESLVCLLLSRNFLWMNIGVNRDDADSLRSSSNQPEKIVG